MTFTFNDTFTWVDNLAVTYAGSTVRRRRHFFLVFICAAAKPGGHLRRQHGATHSGGRGLFIWFLYGRQPSLAVT